MHWRYHYMPISQARHGTPQTVVSEEFRSE
jgi:hypothetical protein